MFILKIKFYCLKISLLNKMSDSYNRLKKLSNDKIDKKSTVTQKTIDYNVMIYFLLITFFLIIILSLF